MKKAVKRFLVVMISIMMTMGLVGASPMPLSYAADNVKTESDKPYLISTSKKVTTSSYKGENSGENAIDGSDKTRWESNWGDDVKGDHSKEWIMIDLGKESQVTSIVLIWESACATDYVLQAYDSTTDEWKDIKNITDGKAGKVTYDFNSLKTTKVRMNCNKKAMDAYGYSLFEFQVYGFNGLYKVNLAQGKDAKCSSKLDAWWMYDSNHNIRDGQSSDAKNAVDGDSSTKWRSDEKDSGFTSDAGQWVYVDLEDTYEIGEVNIQWDGDCAARVYDIQTSDDAKDWKTIYRTLSGDASTQTVKLNGIARYVRVFVRSRYRESYVAIKELQVFRQMEDEKKTENEIPALPEKSTVKVTGDSDEKGSYDTNDIYFPRQARDPKYLSKSLKAPVASNDWWQSLLINKLGNALSLLPLKAKYDADKGLSVLTASQSWWNKADDYTQGAVTSTVSESQPDFYVKPSDYDGVDAYNEVTGYSDYHVKAKLYDHNGAVMETTFVKGCPYMYFEFTNKTFEINSETIDGLFDEKGDVLTNVGDILTTDHIGVRIKDDDNKKKTMTSVNNYCLTLPEKSTITRTKTGLEITVSGDDHYMSVGTMTKASLLESFYKHGYAFVTDTTAGYHFEESKSKISSSFTATTKLKREGFSDQTYQLLLPHQWQKYHADENDGQDLKTLGITYSSPRGDLRLFEGNTFTTSDTFYGMVPQFTTPKNKAYSETELKKYLDNLADSTKGDLIGTDAYWQGKSLHPLAMGVLVADQIGDTEYKKLFLSRLKVILSDWYTYSGSDDKAYFFYDKQWGTLYYKDSEFGANKDISDHHFTYGYYMFASAVLATYDEDFYNSYKSMINLLAHDYANPDKDNKMFCRFRSFDPYEGHSWAGGYADNDNGNNQEAGNESLFGWVGLYMWSLKDQNKSLRDASIYGFTTEENAVKHYWFNYYGVDKDGFDTSGWPADWPSKTVGQVYGSNYFYGTFFGGYPIYVYGIHWLPISEYMTIYGVEQKQCNDLYQGLLKDTQGQKDAHPETTDYPDTTNSWQHLTIPWLSLTDPDQALGQIDRKTQSAAEGFDTYWFANNMEDLGKKTTDIYATNGAAASVYEKTVNGKKTYTAMAWNPTTKAEKITFRNSEGTVGSATIGARALVRLDPTIKDAVQVTKPEFSLDSDTYDDTQYLKITSDTEGAKIYYTTDGTTPTAASTLYTGRIVVTSDTTIKAVAIKDNCIDSQSNDVTIKINGSSTTTGVNLARGKKVTTSSQKDANVGSAMVDHDATTRWESGASDDQWAYVDLGASYKINKVKLSWEASYATDYEIQVSDTPDDESSWKSVYHETNGDGKFDTDVFDAVNARYVRMKGNKRGTDYGYSLYEMGVYASRQISTPELSLKSGTYEGNQYLSMASGTKGVEIRYTLDGSEPTKDSALYVPGLVLSANAKVKAKAFKTGMIASETASADYVINNGTVDKADHYSDVDKFKVKADEDIVEETLAGEEVDDDSDVISGNLAYGKKAIVSSSENEGTNVALTDGNLGTTWSSAYANNENKDSESATIDLGESQTFNQVKLDWVVNTVPGNQYKIQVSDDNQTWKTVYVFTKDTNKKGIDTCDFADVKARYVKMQGVKIGQGWGYALREFEVRESDASDPFGEDVATNAMVTSDGVDNASALSDNKSSTAATTTKDNAWVQLDLAKTYGINQIVLDSAKATGHSYVIKVSEDGTTWETIANGKSEKTSEAYDFATKKVRYVKIEMGADSTGDVLNDLHVYTVGKAAAQEEKVTYYQATAAKASSEGAVNTAVNAADGNTDTRWESDASDDQWIYEDLGETKSLNTVYLKWETAYAKGYQIQVATANPDDESSWTTVFETSDGKGNEETQSFKTTQARYVRMKGLTRGTAYGYSLYEMKAGYKEAIKAKSVILGPGDMELAIGKTKQLEWVVNPSNAENTDVKFTSSDDDVVSVTSAGVIKAKKTGAATITVTTDEGSYTSSIKVQVTGQIETPEIKAAKKDKTSVSLSWNKIDHAKYYDVYQATSNSGDYVKVNTDPITDTSYVVKNLSGGNYYYKVMAKAESNSPYYKDSNFSIRSEAMKVASDLPVITLESDEATMKVNDTLKLSPTITPASSTVTYTSSDEDVADVTNGVVTSRKVGEATITITADNNGNVATKTITITVVDKLTTPRVDKTVAGHTVTLKWDAVAHATSYNVYRAVSNGTYALLGNTKATSYTEASLAANAYSYRVVAMGDKKNFYDSDESASVSVTIGGDTSGNTNSNTNTNTNTNSTDHSFVTISVDKVNLTYLKSKKKKKLSLNFKRVDGAAGYQIAYRKKGAKKWSYKTCNSLKPTLSRLARKKYYYVKVHAFKMNGTTRIYGSYSKTKKAKVK